MAPSVDCEGTVPELDVQIIRFLAGGVGSVILLLWFNLTVPGHPNWINALFGVAVAVGTLYWTSVVNHWTFLGCFAATLSVWSETHCSPIGFIAGFVALWIVAIVVAIWVVIDLLTRYSDSDQETVCFDFSAPDEDQPPAAA